VATYGKHLPLKAQAVFGGMNIFTQIKKLRQGADILIATPGRLLDLISQKAVDLRDVEIFVLDEADRMMDMGFIHDIKKVIALIPANKQSLLFSATFSKEIKNLAQTLLKSPETIEIAPHNTPTELVSQVVYPVDSRRKRELLSFLISSQDWKQVLVFTRTKHAANRLTEALNEDGITAGAIHGNKTQQARMKALADFKKGVVRVLVATDIVSRGLDIDQLPHVVNFELPPVAEDYVHRIGRTGRAGNRGCAYSLVCVDERRLLADVERLLKQKIPVEKIPGFEVDPTIAPQPIRRGGGGGHRPPRKNFKAGRENGRPQRHGFQRNGKGRSNDQRGRRA
jgi:ATP-dependent RNA helicase RhlE